MKGRSLFIVSIFIISLLTLMPTIGSSAFNVTAHQNLLVAPRYFNITVPSSYFNQDPYFYSFEAYHANITGKPEVINIGTNVLFNDTGLSPIARTVNIPQGNYSMEILNVSIREFNGTQYDRQVYIFADGVPIFWGSTQEIHNSTAEAIVTPFENLLKGDVTFDLVIENFYDAKVNITGLYEMNVSLLLYPGSVPYQLPNEFIPLFINDSGYNYSYVVLNPIKDSVSSNVSIPMRTYKAQLLLYEEGGGLDEFWYANEPATRQILVYYNGYLAGDVNPFETIYTGGIDLFYWKPVTSADTLSYHYPYFIDLTPMLAISHNTTITFKVTNLKTALQLTGSTAYDWDLSGVLMLWVNQSDPMIGGKLISYTGDFIDSSPIFISGYTPSSCYYLEGGHFLINYSSVLIFNHGKEIASTQQEGKFTARQTFNSVYQYVYLDEEFQESVKDEGIYNYTLKVEGNYPISMYSDAVAIPLTPTSKIPYNLSYVQNGSLTLSPTFQERYTFNNDSGYCILHENVNSLGGFSGIIEVINKYGGSVLVSLTSNNAVTSKTLNLTFVQNDRGFTENFYFQGIQNSTVNISGYYSHISEKYSYIGDPSIYETFSIINGIYHMIYGIEIKFLNLILHI
jgi:hypothetical protein